MHGADGPTADVVPCAVGYSARACWRRPGSSTSFCLEAGGGALAHCLAAVERCLARVAGFAGGAWAAGPGVECGAWGKWTLLSPLREGQGFDSSLDWVRRGYGGRTLGRKTSFA